MAEKREHPHLLLWYVTGDLEPRQARETEAHLARCDDCATEARALSSMLEALRKHYPAGPPQAFRRPAPGAGRRSHPGLLAGSPWIRRAIVASAVVAASLIVLAVPVALGRRVPGWASPGIREIRSITMSPPLRGAGKETVLEGAGPWALTFTLPYGAPEGRYEATLERRSETIPLAPATILTTGEEGQVSAVLESVPGKGRYRLILRSVDHPGAPEAVYYFIASGP